jgi:hypothetical protein
MFFLSEPKFFSPVQLRFFDAFPVEFSFLDRSFQGVGVA